MPIKIVCSASVAPSLQDRHTKSCAIKVWWGTSTVTLHYFHTLLLLSPKVFPVQEPPLGRIYDNETKPPLDRRCLTVAATFACRSRGKYFTRSTSQAKTQFTAGSRLILSPRVTARGLYEVVSIFARGRTPAETKVAASAAHIVQSCAPSNQLENDQS